MEELIQLVNEYDYPSALFDFNNGKEIRFESYRDLERYISKQLKSELLHEIKDGLSNVLYWGHYRAGYRDVRVNKFRDGITEGKLDEFRKLLLTGFISPLNIKDIGMPQFSGFAFVSKIMMFLHPDRYVTLDKKIMQLKDANNRNNPFNPINFGEKDTTIRITTVSQNAYVDWCELCESISRKHGFIDKIAVDIERGFFRMVENGQIDLGKRIISEFTSGPVLLSEE